jgi:hypothetical protein
MKKRGKKLEFFQNNNSLLEINKGTALSFFSYSALFVER